jgi:mono/diheme cytochrome c family protein
MNHKVKKIKQSLYAVIILAALAGLTSCEKASFAPPAVDPTATWHFQADIQPIFNANCISCHGATKSPDLRDGKSYDALKKGGYINAPADAVTSKLYTKMSSSGHMARSTESDRLKVLYWITQGALKN